MAEKILLKNGRMTGYFISNQESLFYQSEKFTTVLRFVQNNPALCKMKESNDKLMLSFLRIDTVGRAIHMLRKVIGNQNENSF